MRDKSIQTVMISSMSMSASDHSSSLPCGPAGSSRKLASIGSKELRPSSFSINIDFFLARRQPYCMEAEEA